MVSRVDNGRVIYLLVRRSRRAATSSGYVAQTYKSRRSLHRFAYAGLAYSYDLLLQPSIRLTFKLLLTLITCFA